MADLSPEQAHLRTQRRQERLRLVLIGLVTMGLLLAPWGRLSAVLQGRQTLSGAPAYTPRHPSQLDQVDLEALHTYLLPRWSRAAALPGDPDDQRQESRTWLDVAAAVAPDPNLAALAAELRASERDAWGNHKELRWVVWAWNQYVEPTGWRLEGRVLDPGTGAFLRLRSYRVQAEGLVLAGGTPRRVRIVRRADYTDSHVGYLGHAGEADEGAILIAEDIEQFTLDALWPLLDPALDRRRSGVARAWAPAVRAELTPLLKPEHLLALQQTAPLREAAVSALQQAEARADCSAAALTPLTLRWDGIPEAQQPALRALVEREQAAACPALTADELQALVQRPAAPHLEDALAALVALAARIPALHEAHHLADRERTLRCSSCLTTALTELSAYLATFSDPDSGAAAFYQACRATHSARGGHAEAVSEAARYILPRGCVNPPPDDFRARAAAARAELLGQDDAPVLLPGFPLRLPLSG